MRKSKSNDFVFYKNSSSGMNLLVVYVDDIVITRSDSLSLSLSLSLFLIDKLHKYIDKKSIQEVYKEKSEKTVKTKG